VSVEKGFFRARQPQAKARKAQFLFLAHVAMESMESMDLSTFAREETQHFFVIPPACPAWLEFDSSE
jgi:hypothetical protein